MSAEQERFRVRSVSVDPASEVSAIVELPGDPSPKASDFHLLINDEVVGSAQETRGLDLNVMFLVDVSGSMKGSKSDSPLNDAKKALSSFLTKTREQDRLALTSFADSDKPLASFNDSRERISATVGQLATEGTKTRLYQALDNALKNRPKDDPRMRRILVVISDGKDEGSEVTREQVMADSKAALVPIYTVFRGKTEPPFRAILELLANAAGGKYFFTRNERELANALAEIYQLEKSSLIVRFTYPRDSAGGTTENAEIELKRPEGKSLRAKFPEALPVPFVKGGNSTAWLIGFSGAALICAAVLWVWLRRQKAAAVSTKPSTVEFELDSASVTDVPSPSSPAHRATTVIGQYFPVPARGQPTVILRGVAGPVDGRQHAVEKEIFSIGAGAANDLSIAEDEYISGEHAYLRYEKGSLFVFDKASRNGTFVNDDRVPQTGIVLRPGDRIKIGVSTFEVVMPAN
jgi:Mg-chelatase subunit ChlD